MTTAAPQAPPSWSEGHGRNLRCQVFKQGQPAGHISSLEDISDILEEGGSLIWLDMVNPGPNDLDVMQREFNLHPLAVEDAITAHQRPKIESYDAYYFLDIHATSLRDTSMQFHEIAIFAGANYLITVRHDPVFPTEEIEKRWAAHPEQLREGAGFLLYTILDTVVDGYYPVVQRFEDRVDQLEEALLRRQPRDSDTLPEIFAMKKDGQMFRQAVLPMRDILAPIIRGDLALFSADEIVYYRDVYDHAVRVIEQLDSMRDMVNSALEIHLSVAANRQGEVNKQLTVIATIFLPLSFIVGFFGQNFGFLVAHITTTPTFWFLGMGSELAAVAIMLLYFKRKGWF